MKEAIAGAPLIHLDSFTPCKFRGAWRQNRIGQWYELDYFLGASFFDKAMQNKACAFAGTSDHMGKKTFLSHQLQ